MRHSNEKEERNLQHVSDGADRIIGQESWDPANVTFSRGSPELLQSRCIALILAVLLLLLLLLLQVLFRFSCSA